MAAPPKVSIGIQDMPVPWKTLVDAGVLEKATGYTVQWRRYDTGADVARALQKGEIQIGEMGSSPATAAATRGEPLQVFWISADIHQAEALVARREAGVRNFKDLSGKTVAVPQLSTAHYQLFAAVAETAIARNVTIVPMKPADIAAAWKAQRIDAAFVWNPVLDQIKPQGTLVADATQLAGRGYPTFDALVVQPQWARQHAPFMRALVVALGDAVRQYASQGAGWNDLSPPVQAIARATGMPAVQVLPGMRLYRFPQAQEQQAPGGLLSQAPRAMANTALFQQVMRVNNSVQPSYAPYVTSEFLPAPAATR